MKTNITLFGVGAVTLLSAAYAASAIASNTPTAVDEGDHEIVEMHHQYLTDFSDDKILIGSSHNVFIGTVVKQSGTKERGIGPETQFEVDVLENIKGDLKGTVTVNQQGGYKDGYLYAVEDGDMRMRNAHEPYLLKQGSTYIFATRYNEKENWHTLNSFPTARKLLSTDNLDAAQLKVITDSDERVNALKQAYPNEILLQADVNAGKTYNSYRSAQEAKAQQESNVSESVVANPEALEPAPEPPMTADELQPEAVTDAPEQP